MDNVYIQWLYVITLRYIEVNLSEPNEKSAALQVALDSLLLGIVDPTDLATDVTEVAYWVLRLFRGVSEYVTYIQMSQILLNLYHEVS